MEPLSNFPSNAFDGFLRPDANEYLVLIASIRAIDDRAGCSLTGTTRRAGPAGPSLAVPRLASRARLRLSVVVASSLKPCGRWYLAGDGEARSQRRIGPKS